MELQEFIKNFAAQLEETDVNELSAETVFRDLEEWSSMSALSIMAMVIDVYNVALSAQDVRKSRTIEDLFNIVKAKSDSNE